MINLRDWTLQYSMLWAAAQNELPDDGCNCPEGFTANGEECEKVSTKPTIQPPTFTALRLIKVFLWKSNINGTYIYNPGFGLNGAGSKTLYTNNPFWRNILQNEVDGAYNRCAIWSQTYSNYQQIGFSVCINIPTTKTYLVGFGVDNFATVRIDSVEVIKWTANVEEAFRYWHVFPVTIKKGLHVMEIIGINYTLVAAIAAEIYDASPSQLMAISNVPDLDAVTIFSTKNMVGKYTNLGTNGYPIDSEYALVECMGNPPFYRKVEYANCE